MADIDLKYAREFLLRMNKLTALGNPITEHFKYEELTLWQFYQEALFADIKVFSKTRTLPKEAASLGARRFFSGLLITVFSLPGFFLSFVKRPTILFYAVDRAEGVYRGDTRIEDVFKFLLEKKVSFREVLHSSNGGVQRGNFWKRGRAPLYSEAIDFIFDLASFFGLVTKGDMGFIERVDWGDWQQETEKEFAKRLLKKYATLRSVSVFKIKLYTKLFSLLRPKAFFTIDDGRHYYFELLTAARKAKVPSFAFQHGHITKYQVGWQKLVNYSGEYMYPDQYLLWSQYWIDELTRFDSYIPLAARVIGGSKVPLSSLVEPQKLEKLWIVIPFETIAPHKELIPYVEKLCALPYVELLFKLRPDMDKERQMKLYGIKEIKGKVTASTGFPYKEAESDVAMVLGVYSSYLYDMLSFGLPIGILDTSFDYGEGMVDNGLAEKVHLASLEEDIQRLARRTTSERIAAREKLFGKEPKRLFETLVSLGTQHDWYV